MPATTRRRRSGRSTTRRRLCLFVILHQSQHVSPQGGQGPCRCAHASSPPPWPARVPVEVFSMERVTPMSLSPTNRTSDVVDAIFIDVDELAVVSEGRQNYRLHSSYIAAEFFEPDICSISWGVQLKLGLLVKVSGPNVTGCSV